MEGARRSQDVFPTSELASGALFAAPEDCETSVRLHLKVHGYPPACHFLRATSPPTSTVMPPDPAAAVPLSPVTALDASMGPRLVSLAAPIPATPRHPPRLAGREKILLDERVEVAIEHGFDVPHL
jgi:hypothetical protein